MSRYDRDDNPRRKPRFERSPSSGILRQAANSDARGQGGGADACTTSLLSVRFGPRNRLLRLERQSQREPNPTRERTYDLRDSEVQTLADIGAFRAIKTEDLVQYRYGGDARQAHRDLKHLVEQGLVLTRTTYTERNVYVGLTRKGRRYLEHGRPANTASRQVFYHGFVKRREARHDAAIYRLYQCENQRITQAGGKVNRVILDFELKAIHQSRTGKYSLASRRGTARAQARDR